MMELDLRKTPTVEGAIKCDVVHNGVRVVIYEPGNGTRYEVTFVPVPGEACKALGCQDGSYCVVLTSFRPSTSHFFAPGGYITPNYVREHLRDNWSDAVVLAELIGWVLGCGYMSCEEATVKFRE